jgi:putative DNA primase/helicase
MTNTAPGTIAVIEPNNIPVDLRVRPQWVTWWDDIRDGKPTKVPLIAGTRRLASVTDPATWASFETSYRAFRQGVGDGVGYVFSRNDPYAGVDLDRCVDPATGQIEDVAWRVILTIHSYWEISPSGRGVHIIARGQLPDGARKRGRYEMYDRARFFTVTGRMGTTSPHTIVCRSEELHAIHTALLAPRQQAEPARHQSEAASRLTDDEVRRRTARTGNSKKFAKLWRGEQAGYPSFSEGDLALVGTIAAHTSDPAQIDRVFRLSNRNRPKWHEVHYSSGLTYGQMTIRRALQGRQR